MLGVPIAIQDQVMSSTFQIFKSRLCWHISPKKSLSLSCCMIVEKSKNLKRLSSWSGTSSQSDCFHSVAQSCPTLCDPADCSMPGFPFPHHLQKLAQKVTAAAKSLQSCPTLSDPIDGSPPGSSIHGIFQARVLEGKK